MLSYPFNNFFRIPDNFNKSISFHKFSILLIMSKQKYQTGLVIGRFQPLHLGHKYLIEKALEVCDKLIIGIGSANKNDGKNPYPADMRVEFLKKFVNEEKLETRVSKI